MLLHAWKGIDEQKEGIPDILAFPLRHHVLALPTRPRRPREMLMLAEGLNAAVVAERLEIAVATVHVHAHRARVRIAQAQARHEEVELHRFILHEALPGPVPSDPPHGLYRVTGPGQGERVRLRGAVVTVDDLADRG